jgi:hypothetical protein
MKFNVSKLQMFFWGICLGVGVCVSLDKLTKKSRETAFDKTIDISLGHAALNDLPVLNKVLLFAESNQWDKAQFTLCDSAWWKLEGVWALNKKYDGALDSDFNPLLIGIYPHLKQQVNLSSFTNLFPKYLLTEMTNFMKDADNIVR